MKKFVLLGDMHIDCRNSNLSFAEYHLKFFEEMLFPYLDATGINTIVQFGDIFDRRKFINFRILDMFKRRFFDILHNKKIKLIIILGNHDLFFRNTLKLNSPSNLLAEYDNIEVIDSASCVDFFGLQIDLIPWITPDEQEETFHFIENSKSKIAFGHFEFAGYEMYKGMKSEHGYNTDVFKNYEQIYSGHYHTRSSDGRIHYLGTPYEITWSDCNDNKGFYTFDVETRTSEFIQNPYKIHHKIYFNSNTTENFDFNYVKNSYIKIIVTEQVAPETINSFVDQIYKNSDPIDITVSDISSIASISNDDIIDNIDVQDPINILMLTIDNDIKAKIDKVNIKKMAMEIYQETLAMEKNSD